MALVYPSEGTPLITGSIALADKAPHPNAARRFISYLFWRQTQRSPCDADRYAAQPRCTAANDPQLMI